MSEMVLEGDWVKVAKTMRSNWEAITNYISVIQKETAHRKANGNETAVLVMAAMVMQGGPIVQYLIPQALLDQLWDCNLDLDAPLESYIGLPFSPMAIAPVEDPEAFTVFNINDKKTMHCVEGDGAYILDLTKTSKQLSDNYGHGKRMDLMLAILMYVSGGDHSHWVVSRPKGGKRDRNNSRPTVIRGEIGGKFVSALKRYEHTRQSFSRC